jgi:Uma2 family endonuclease
MSTTTLTKSRKPSSDRSWIPSSLYRLTLEQYEAMVATGIFTGRDKVQLINGYLVAKMTQNTPHATADDLCGDRLNRMIPRGWYVRVAKPIRLPSESSEPEPDRCVVRGGIRDYSARHPGPADLALVVEVADSSLDDDRMQADIYGRAGIPVYWIINLIDRQVEVYSNPGPSGYQSLEIFAPPHVLTVMIDGVEVGEIPVAEILP